MLSTLLLTLLTLIMFAANSVLARLALQDQAIDAGSFTAIRLLSGAATLLLILQFSRRSHRHSVKSTLAAMSKGKWLSAAMLTTYAVAFSYAYLSLDTGIGALVLFAAVQMTMISVSLWQGARFQAIEWFGLVLAFSGFVYLIAPNLTTPSGIGFVLMTLSGIAWGLYTLAGKKATQPTSETAYNFFRAIPFAVVIALTVFVLSTPTLTTRGVLLAIASGALASGCGYALWYQVLGKITTMQAGVVQLFVPVIATFGGVLFAGEALTLRLVIASVWILGGLMCVLVAKKQS
ncbi:MULTISPECIES: DMT family transporter [unclassified Vibrio]|uniref:DMT family transporter n=1 Tax=Vibrio sp. HB236076 TaxID=3232307 RepID=A0AB39HG34_9VIBR|nr:DMT family transporter [Vibrio sp. HB161653]MDP5253162.1 DMT family transporter [Vibrio sp. HB161653]